jgi:hypothetical protein
VTSKKKKDDDERVLGTGAAGDIDNPGASAEAFGVPQDSTPVDNEPGDAPDKED